MNETHVTQIISLISGSTFLTVTFASILICCGFFVAWFIYSHIKNKMSMDSHNFNTSKDIIDRITEENNRLTEQNEKLKNEIKALNLSISVQQMNNNKVLDALSKLEMTIREKDYTIKDLTRKLRQYSDIEDNLT